MVEAKKFEVPDIYPLVFLIEILDDEQNPIKEVEISYTVDGKYTKTAMTDEHGILNVQPKPVSEIKLSLAGEEVSTGKESAGIGEDVENAELLQSQPAGFTIEILDFKHNPVAKVNFSVAIDGGDSKTEETDNNGVLRINKPKEELVISLVGKEGS